MKGYFLALAFGLTFSAGFAQTTTSPSEQVATELDAHFNRLKSRSNHYRENTREYKVVDVKVLDAFWQSVQATVQNHERGLVQGGKSSEENLQKAQTTIATQAEQIQALKLENARKENAMQENTFAVDHLSVLGLGINKNFFVIATFAVMAALIVACGVFFSLYKKAKTVTDEKVKAFSDMDLEFTEFKKASRDRELKIKRELQTETNSKEEMRQQLATFQKQTSV